MSITCNGTWEESNPDACLRVRTGGVQPTNMHYHGISLNKSFPSLRLRLPQELTSSRQGQYYCKMESEFTKYKYFGIIAIAATRPGNLD